MTHDPSARRLERYLAVAALPVAGISGALSADIIHYGGDVIRIDRSSGDGEAVLGLPSSFNAASARGLNQSMTATVSSQFAFASAAMQLGVLSNGGADGLGFAICAEGSFGQLGGLAGSLFGSDFAAGCNFLEFLDEGAQIDNQLAFADNGAVAMSVSAMATVFGNVVADEAFSAGEWAAQGSGDESRGFVGWQLETAEGTSYGWMDVAWDGSVLSIFDWAFSTDGSIAAGQTSEVSSVPGGTGLAMLALGAAGLRRRRKHSA
jgi:MYXO-CTERM domain-containing protein